MPLDFGFNKAIRPVMVRIGPDSFDRN